MSHVLLVLIYKSIQLTRKQRVINGVAGFQEHMQRVAKLTRKTDVYGQYKYETAMIEMKLVAVFVSEGTEVAKAIMTIANVLIDVGHYANLEYGATENNVMKILIHWYS